MRAPVRCVDAFTTIVLEMILYINNCRADGLSFTGKAAKKGDSMGAGEATSSEAALVPSQPELKHRKVRDALA